MKYFLHGINDWLKDTFEKDTATRGRPFQFRIVVATLIGLVIILFAYSVTQNFPL